MSQDCIAFIFALFFMNRLIELQNAKSKARVCKVILST